MTDSDIIILLKALAKKNGQTLSEYVDSLVDREGTRLGLIDPQKPVIVPFKAP